MATSSIPQRVARGRLTWPYRQAADIAARWLGLAALPGLVLVGAGIRFWNLGADDFWTDELATVTYASSLSTTYRDTHPPLFYLIMYAWLSFAPVHETLLRIPSAFIGTLNILAVYLFARSMCDRLTGVLAAGLVALATMHIWHSQEARMYSTLAVTSTLSSWAMLRYCRDASGRNAALYTLTASALLYTHLFGLMTFAAQSLIFLYYALFVKRGDGAFAARFIAAQAVAGASVLPWLTYLAMHPGTDRVDWIPPVSVETVVNMFKQFSSGFTTSWVLLTLLGLLGCLSLRYRRDVWRGDRIHEQTERRTSFVNTRRVALADRDTTVFLVCLMLVPMIAAFLLSVFVRPLFVSRYLIATSIPFYVLAARGMSGIPFRSLRLSVIAIVFSFSVLGIQQYVKMPHRPSWQTVVQALGPRVQQTDLLVFDAHRPDVFDYYADRYGLMTGVRRFYLQAEPPTRPADAQTRLVEQLADGKRFWLIQFGADGGDRHLNDFVKRTYSLSDDLSVPAIRVRLFQVRR